jgi:hypothetical protein
MIKHIFKISLLFFFLVGCETDNVTKPEVTEGHDQALIGKWLLTTSMLNGTVVNYENLCDCPVELQFDANGTGIVWKKNYGLIAGSTSFGWSTSGNKVTIHEVNDYPILATYTVKENSYTMSYEKEEGNVEMTYSKQ